MTMMRQASRATRLSVGPCGMPPNSRVVVQPKKRVAARAVFPGRHRSALRSCTDRAVFQMHPPRGDASIASVREAYEACAMYVDENGKRQCYALFGLDSKRMDRYYHTVMDLEKALESEDGVPVAPPERPTIGFFKLFSSLLMAFLSFLFYLVTSIFTVKTQSRKLVLK